MRLAGTLPDAASAVRLSDVLAAEGIAVERRDETGVGGGVELYIVDEDQVEQGRRLASAYLASPDEPRFTQAIAAAESRRDQKRRATMEAAAKRAVQQAERPESIWTTAPATLLLVVLCLIVAVLTGVGSENESVIDALKISTVLPAVAVLPEVAAGQAWRLISPIFLHFGMDHLIFNMVALYSLGKAIEIKRGTGFLLMLTLTLGLASNLVQYVYSGPNFGGISGVICGLFGYLLIKSWLQPSLGIRIGGDSAFLFGLWIVLCLTVIDGIANAAHLAGLAAGAIVALVGVGLERAKATE